MPETRIDAAITGTDQHVDFSVDAQSTDAPTGHKETTWQDTEWNTYLGYYKDEKPQR